MQATWIVHLVGDGLSPEFADAGWEKMGDEIYRDRG
jgi:hypothetical protein